MLIAAKQCLAFCAAFVSLVRPGPSACSLFGLILGIFKPEFHVSAHIPLAELGWFFFAPFVISLLIRIHPDMHQPELG